MIVGRSACMKAVILLTCVRSDKTWVLMLLRTTRLILPSTTAISIFAWRAYRYSSKEALKSAWSNRPSDVTVRVDDLLFMRKIRIVIRVDPKANSCMSMTPAQYTSTTITVSKWRIRIQSKGLFAFWCYTRAMQTVVKKRRKTTFCLCC